MTLKHETFIRIEVRNPRTHISREKALYTDYEIVVKTNNIAFASNESSVRRRYSDFQWLRMRLINQYQLVTRSPPELPPKRLFGRFQRQFLKRRQAGLQKFLARIVEDNQYLSDVAVHLFLQSSLPVKEIERYFDGMVSDGDILDLLHSPGRSKPSGLSRSMAEIPQFDAPIENDSGCCYSTTSSINDLMHTTTQKTQENWRYYMSVPLNLDRVAANETDDHAEEEDKDDNGLSLQIDSGQATSGSQQSLHRPAMSSESDSDFRASFDYDADDESDHCFLEGSLGSVDLVFHSEVLPIDQALRVLLMRPKISDRILATDDDTDEEFHESEYDVIDSDNEGAGTRTRRKSSSSSKKKLSRSLSDVKLRRRPSRASMMKEDAQRKTSFQSMPNICAPLQRRPRRPSGGFHCKRLSVHKENPEKVKITVEGFTTSGSTGKCNRSDDADESFVPNSEMDCYSTWNSPAKMINGNVDSSEIEASLESHTELRPRATYTARNLFKRIISRQEHRMHEELCTKVSGRFRVSVIREEDHASRRGSASSTELTIANHTLECELSTNRIFNLVTAVGEKHSFFVCSNGDETSEKSSMNTSDPANIEKATHFTNAPVKMHNIDSVPNAVKEEREKATPCEAVREIPASFHGAVNTLETNNGLFYQGTVSEEKLTIEEGHSSVPYKEDQLSTNNNGSLEDGASDIACGHEQDAVKKEKLLEGGIHKRVLGEGDDQLNALDHIRLRSTTKQDSNDVNNGFRPTKCVSHERGFLHTAESFLKDLPSSNQFLNLFSVNGNIYTDDSMRKYDKSRAVSPSPAILGTYDVIPDVSAGLLDDYDILSDRRE